VARVRRVVVVCANDGYVMQAWKAERGLQAWFVGDPFGKLLGALDLLLPEPDPELGPGRSKRAALFVDHGIVRLREVSVALHSTPCSANLSFHAPRDPLFPQLNLCPTWYSCLRSITVHLLPGERG
jgi:peroxiredoxin